MKLSRHLLLLPGLLLLACNKDDSDDVKPNDVPEVVKTSFATRFTTVTNLEWEKKGDDYEADFDVNTVDYKALLNPSGTVLKYKYDILATELPAAVQATINQKYAGMRIDEAEKLFQGTETNPLYQVDLDSNGQDKDVVFSADGQEVTTPAYWD
ncbi:hypothetical protein [Hymenobacter norwichensis]|uniref:hypothetical protein n=1 Tax=Hymenobacter norwichensis TaxID=223903 RepID=UPI0003B7A357|nr:hypothetical protein [Hymenobacter norwichensis]